MPAYARRSRRTVDIWPGWVDALSTLLIIVIFVLLVFVLGQYFLGQALNLRDQTIGQLGDMLGMERKARAELELSVGRLTTDLQNEKDANAALTTQLADATAEAAARTTEVGQLKETLGEATAATAKDREQIAKQVQQLAQLQQSIKALEALKTSLENKIAKTEGDVAKERGRSIEAEAQMALMNQQVQDLQKELERLSATLDASDKLTAEQKAQISDLGKRMNRALAGKVQELQRYRSEFFGRLRDILGARPGVTVVGDRFVFQSEVLFASGSAELGADGQRQMSQLARTLIDVSKAIPPELHWILRVDGHTDNVPIAGGRTNWELSTARAIAVVKYLITQGVPPERLAAAGFGEYQPIELGNDPVSRARNRRIELKLDQI